MTDIRRLDDVTVERIAAGEVVERPASVVKELVENSLDAGASRVGVAVDAGGADRIEVRDDGTGMTEAAARLAVEEHTTSKIGDVEDLEAGVGTLGFRGEALHAIGAVSHLTVRTRTRGEPRGTELRVEGGEVVDVSPVGCPEGTTVTVEELFYNVPARRKYLKAEATEFSRVNDVVSGYALANPDVAVALSHGDRETFATTGAGDLRSAVLAVYGREVAENMVPLEEELPDGPLDGVDGLVSHPETNRASRKYVDTFVNGRYVTATAVREAVVEAYGRQLAADRYPFAVVSLEVDPATVDVNVHPRKLEVRFADEAGMQRQVREAVASALLSAGLIRTSAPRGRSKAAQTEIAPGGDGDEVNRTDDGDQVGDGDADGEPRGRAGPDDVGDDGEEGGAGEDSRHKGVDGDGGDGDGGNATTVPRGTTGAERGGGPDDRGRAGPRTTDRGADEQGSTGVDARASAEADRRTEAGPDGDGASPDRPATDATAASTGWHPRPVATDRDRDERDGDERDQRGRAHRDRDDRRSRKFRRRPAQTTFDGSDPTRHEFDALPAMRVLGQLQDTYVVAETDDGLLLVDQHAADERVNYERLRDRFAGDVTTQALAEPVDLELTAAEAALAADAGEALARLGFHVSLVGDRSLRVTTVPALLADRADAALVRDLLADYADGDAERTVERAVDDLLGDMACYPAVTANESLTAGSVSDLLRALNDCENPYACPHGRPVLVELGATDIEQRFERDYPGHGG